MKRLIFSVLVLTGAYFLVGCDSSSNSQKPSVETPQNENSQKPSVETSLNENIKNALIAEQNKPKIPTKEDVIRIIENGTGRYDEGVDEGSDTPNWSNTQYIEIKECTLFEILENREWGSGVDDTRHEVSKIELSKLDMDQVETSSVDGFRSLRAFTKYNDNSVYQYKISSKGEISNEYYVNIVAFGIKDGADAEAVANALRYLIKLCGG